MKRKTFFKKIPSEEITPLEIYMRFLDDKNSYFFESVEAERNGPNILLLDCLQTKK